MPDVKGDGRTVVGCRSLFSVRHASVAAVHDPQQAVEASQIATLPGGSAEVSFVPLRPGKPTVFLELKAGQTRWLLPLDLDVRKPWSIQEQYVPQFQTGGPRLASPAIEDTSRILTFNIVNDGHETLAGQAQITVAGRTFERDLAVLPRGQIRVSLPLESVWDRLSPGSMPFQVAWAGRTERVSAVNWSLGQKSRKLATRMQTLDLGPLCNADMAKLFSPATQWRIDYTGAQHGVDWRHPMPLRDQHGYVLMNSVLSIFEYGTLPEQVPATKRLKMAKENPSYDRLTGVSFATQPGRLLAVNCTQPYLQFPSQVTVKLPRPRRAEKLYLLTANLVKTLKCYYPGAEIVVYYAQGPPQLHQLIPPYTMPSLVSNICPQAHAVRIGQLEGGGNPVADPGCYLSVIDVILDSARPVVAIEFRSVATETLLGLVGLTLLEAECP
jgi:hypothetical protein